MSPLAVALRRVQAGPHDLTFASGAVCPVDGRVLGVTAQGWRCPGCLAAWDYQGRRGQWLAADVMAVADAVGVVPAPAPARSGLRTVVVSVVVVLVAAAVVVAGWSTGAAYRGRELPVSDPQLWALAAALLCLAVGIVVRGRRGGVR